MLIEVVPPHLAAQVPSSDLVRLVPNRLRLGELSTVARYGPARADLYAEWWQHWPVPWYSHRYAILACLAPQLLADRVSESAYASIDDAGDGPIREAPAPDFYRIAVEATIKCWAPCFEDFRLGGPGCDALREILEVCCAERLDVALILMPEGKPFRDLYTPEIWRQVDGFLDSLCRDYGICVINAREWVPDEHFTDSHHLLRPAPPSSASALAANISPRCLPARARRRTKPFCETLRTGDSSYVNNPVTPTGFEPVSRP